MKKILILSLFVISMFLLPLATAQIAQECNVDGSASSTQIECNGGIGRNEDATDATIDSCTDGVQALDYMHVNNVYLDKTTATPGSVVNLTCEICCYFSGDYYGFAYYDGDNWENKGTGSCVGGSSGSTCTGVENHSVLITLGANEGVHTLRCMESYSSAPTGTCSNTVDTNYGDSDDINITVEIISNTKNIKTDADTNDISLGNNDNIFIDNGDSKIGFGTTYIPTGSKLMFLGTADSTSYGPHIQFTIPTNNYPLMQLRNWNHDDIAITFDSYYDGSWKSSDAGSNFRIYKSGDLLSLDYSSPTPAGSAITFDDALVYDTEGDVGIGTTTPASDLSVGGTGTSSAEIYGYGGVYSIMGEDGIYGVFGNGSTRGVQACYSSDCTNRYGYLGDDSYGVFGRYDSDTYGYLGGSFGLYGYGDSTHSAYLGNANAGISGTGAVMGIRAEESGDSTGTYYGMRGEATSYGIYSYGGYGTATGASYNYAVRGYVSDSYATNNYGVSGYAYAPSGNAWGIYCGAGTKNWVSPYPYDPLISIVYATLESGENGAYWRGSANLTNGEATVILPDHFEAASSPEYDITVTLNPLSADSKGLAVIESNNAQFRVKELFNGTGSYEFTYMVIGVRRGYEEYEPIQTNMDYVPFQDNQGAMIEENISSQEFYDFYSESQKKIFKKNGILDKDGKINKAVFKDKGWKIFEHPSKEEADSIPDVIGPDGKKEKKWKVIDGDNPPIILNKKDAEKLIDDYQKKKEKEKKEKLKEKNSKK